jgi:chemotaxis protein CheX
MQNLEPDRTGESERPMEVESGSVITVVQEIWSSMLGMDAVDAGRQDPSFEQQKALLGFVNFGGAWQGAVFLHCSRELARKVAAGMFGAEPTSLTNEEISDAIGELVNIIGGNLKHLLPPPCHLSVPLVLENKRSRDTAVLGRLVTNVDFVYENETFRVEVVEAKQSQTAAQTI